MVGDDWMTSRGEGGKGLRRYERDEEGRRMTMGLVIFS